MSLCKLFFLFFVMIEGLKFMFSRVFNILCFLNVYVKYIKGLCKFGRLLGMLLF